MMNSIPYGKQSIDQADINAVVAALSSDFLTQGPAVGEFESAFAKYIGCEYALAVNNGTAALHLAALALNVGEKDNVITTPITFAASANCIRYCGGNVFFADIDPDTYLLDETKVEELIKSKPKGFFTGIIPVDFAGRAVDMEAYRRIADKYGLWIIEDACHSPGGYFMDGKGEKQQCGNSKFADLAVFSFHPVKHIACGEGGMITTNNKESFERLKLLRTHGITKDPACMSQNQGEWYYEMKLLGYNYRLTDFQAALGISQLKKADTGLNRRIEIAKKYDAAFSCCSFIKGHSGFVSGHAYHLYIIETENRTGLYMHLREHNVFPQVHYIPVHTLPYYQNLGHKQEGMPCAEAYYEKCLSLPMFPTLTDAEQDYVIDVIKQFFK